MLNNSQSEKFFTDGKSRDFKDQADVTKVKELLDELQSLKIASSILENYSLQSSSCEEVVNLRNKREVASLPDIQEVWEGVLCFNAELLDSNDVIYAVFSIQDALSIEEVINEPAVAFLDNDTDKEFFVWLQDDYPHTQFIFITEGEEDFTAKADNCKVMNLLAHSTPHEYLAMDKKESLRKELLEMKRKESDYYDDFNISFFDEVNDKLNQEKVFAIKTGFDTLDEVLKGGLMPGIYTIGAISSLGKTTFCLQMADQLAERGNTVLFFSLEQGRIEMMYKSLSRIAKEDETKGITTSDFLTNDITAEEKEFIADKVLPKYAEFADKIAIFNDIRNVTTIEEKISEVKKYQDSNIVVFIDFLQILEFPDGHENIRGAVDFNLSHLKSISDQFKIPVIMISSFNRNNYHKEVSLNSFKESGGIEYSSDVVIGLQLQQMDGNEKFKKEDIQKWKSEIPRKIQLVILKNRNGAIYDRINYKYEPAYNLFSEGQKVEN